MSNPEFIDQPVVVEARLLPDGQINPVAFAWRDKRQAIAGIGRRWQEAADGHTRTHYLVQTATSGIFELCMDTGTGQWRLLRAWFHARLA